MMLNRDFNLGTKKSRCQAKRCNKKILDFHMTFLYPISMRLNIARIYRELQKKKWSRYRLSKETGMANQSLYRIMQGKVGVNFKTIENLAKALGIEEKDLLE